MILRKYGVELHSLTEDDLELIRSWRNDDFVRERMLFQEEISSTDQKTWFAKLDDSMIYLLIVYREAQIGLINVRNINWEERSGEAGILIGDEDYRNSYVPMLAVYCLMDVFFNECQFTQLTARVRKDNENALNFNQDLGYLIQKEYSDHYLLSVSPEDYQKKKMLLKNVLAKFDSEENKNTFSQLESSYLFLRK